jgi:tRNA 2-thiouridine synthesizing protein E
MERTLSALHNADRGRPPTLRQLFGMTREPRVRRGIAAVLDILRAIGSGMRSGTRPSAPLAPMHTVSTQPTYCPTPPAASVVTTRTFAGVSVELDREGFMVDRAAWTREIAGAIAAEYGLADLTAAHWNVIELCRRDAEVAGVSPGLRRITTTLGIGPREMYALFPKGPGMLAARIAGLPKPKSCV